MDHDIMRRVFAALQTDATRAEILLDPSGAPLWASPTVFSIFDVDLTADDPLRAAMHPDDVTLSDDLFGVERAGEADQTFTIDRRFELIVRLRSPSGEWRRVALHLLNLVSNPDVNGMLLQLTLANQESSTVEAFDAAAADADETVVLTALLTTLMSGGTGNSFAAVFDVSDRCIAATPNAPITAGARRSSKAWSTAVTQLLDVCEPIVSPQTGEVLGHLESCSNYPDVRPFTRNLVQTVGRRIAMVLDRERTRRDLRRQADFDSLTGLYNRRAVHEHLRRILPDQVVSVAYIDVNRFKHVNDRYGHEAGDDVLVAVARRLERLCGANDIVARLGGDEFLVVRCIADDQDAPTAKSSTDCALSLSDMQKAVDGVVRTGVNRVSITCSIGIATGPAHRSESLLAQADLAMYEHKRQTRNEVLRTGDGSLYRSSSEPSSSRR